MDEIKNSCILETKTLKLLSIFIYNRSYNHFTLKSQGELKIFSSYIEILISAVFVSFSGYLNIFLNKFSRFFVFF